MLGGIGLSPAQSWSNHDSFPTLPLPKEAMIGVQMGPHSMLYEGIDQVLGFLQEEAMMNTVVMYSHTYYDEGKKPLRIMARDHFRPLIDLSNHNLRRSWERHDNTFFKGTKLRHCPVDASFQYHDREVFSEIRKPADDRGMKVYFRILATKAANGVKYIDNFEEVVVKDVYGRPGGWPC